MSDFVSSLPTFSEAVSGLSRLAFGAFGGVVLGDFAFSGFEVPEYVEISGRQSMHVHKLPGGERVIDVLGDDPADIRWSGMILDGAPQARIQQLEGMRGEGAPLPLQWGSFFYTVVISDFSSHILYGRASYSIACTVLRNELTASLDGDPSLTDSIMDDLSSAIGISPSDLTQAVSAGRSAVAALGVLVPGSPRLAQATAALSGASGALSAAVNGSGAILGQITGASSLTAQVGAAGNVAQAIAGGAYVGRALRNLAP